MVDLIVIGGGIIGSTVYKYFRKIGLKCLLFDAGHKNAGTYPSGGHLKPSWASGLSSQTFDEALEVLDSVWGVKSEKFTLVPKSGEWLKDLLSATVYRVDTDQVMKVKNNLNRVSVVGITQEAHQCRVTTESGETYLSKHVVNSAGVWANLLMETPPIQHKKGISFRLSGQVEKPYIQPWAPYKQIVAHNQTSDTIWIGDGTAILEKNWNKEKDFECLNRCRTSVGANHRVLQFRKGLRAYIKYPGKDPCYFSIDGRVITITGAGKSGTVSAGWAVNKLNPILT